MTVGNNKGHSRRSALLLAVLMLAVVLAACRPGAGESREDQAASVPEPAVTPSSQVAEELLAGMTLREKLCQMIMAAPSDITGVDQVIAAGEDTRQALETYPVGGLFYNKSNLVDRQQVTAMLTSTQRDSKIPLLLTCDEEGGRVNRLMDSVGTTYIGPMLDYQDQGPGVAESNAAVIARDMVSCGFNMDLAPVADVWSNPANTVIGDRAYSDDFAQAAELVAAAVKGFHSGGVVCTLKHFPGHGDTTEDSHVGTAYVHKTLEQLRAEEFLPFQAGIDAGADVVMMAHVTVPAIEEQPAVFSHTLVTEILRGELGFQGVVMTDALEMSALAEHYTNEEIVVRAVQAGVDLLLCPASLDGAIHALTQAVEAGTIPRERIDESVLRILTMKANMGLL